MNLYTIGIEELIVRIHLNNNINGYKIPAMISNSEENNNEIKDEMKSSIYADDTGGILRDDDSIEYFFDEFKDWGGISGASMNEDKTKILAINSEHKEYRNIKFVEELKLLGIIFNKTGVAKKNLENNIKQSELYYKIVLVL
jgi:hypothetical protein